MTKSMSIHMPCMSAAQDKADALKALLEGGSDTRAFDMDGRHCLNKALLCKASKASQVGGQGSFNMTPVPRVGGVLNVATGSARKMNVGRIGSSRTWG